MLEFLRIQDLALIENMELEFASGMNVLTGETGAGKSFILKAVNFLLGEKLTTDMVRPGADRAQVEGVFFLNGEELLLRRELIAETGRSRLYINDRLSSQESVRELRNALILHTSQHGQQKLLQPAFQAKLIDQAITDTDVLQEKNTIIEALLEVSEERKKLQSKFESLSDRRDLLEMQQHEIDKVAPEPDEEDKLEAMRAEARQASTQVANYELALTLLHGDDSPGLTDLLGRLERVLEDMCKDDVEMEADLEAVSALRQGLPTLERRLRRPPQSSSVDMDALEERLYELAQLKRKLRRSLNDIVLLRDEISENLSFLDACGLDLKRLEREEQKHIDKLKVVLDKLIPIRRQAASDFTSLLEKALSFLGFSKDVRVIADFSPVELWPNVFDEKARLLWAPNPGQPPQPLDKIASGGELSRFLLALASIKGNDESSTYIFDEVDAGVGGITLNRVAEYLQLLAKERQMLLITHWPQLAALGNRHFQVCKQEQGGKTSTLCKRLDDASRSQELARMAGGGQQGEIMAQSLLPRK